MTHHIKHLILFWLVALAIPLFAQVQDTTDVQPLPCLTAGFYQSSNIEDRDYDYELLNIKRTLIMQSEEVNTLGFITMMGIIFGNAFLAIENDWNLWIDIPVASVAAVSSIIPFYYWHRQLQEKAESIPISTEGQQPIVKSVTIGATSIPNPIKANNIGLEITASF